MASLTNPFETWLATLPALGYDRDWIRHNAALLRPKFDRGEQMPPCPPATIAPRDRYEEL